LIKNFTKLKSIGPFFILLLALHATQLSHSASVYDAKTDLNIYSPGINRNYYGDVSITYPISMQGALDVALSLATSDDHGFITVSNGGKDYTMIPNYGFVSSWENCRARTPEVIVEKIGTPISIVCDYYRRKEGSGDGTKTEVHGTVYFTGTYKGKTCSCDENKIDGECVRIPPKTIGYLTNFGFTVNASVSVGITVFTLIIGLRLNSARRVKGESLTRLHCDYWRSTRE